jgi:mono/diheme cytochrome c family protein
LSADEGAARSVTEEQAGHLAAQQALERGRHLVEARYGCTECHGRDFSGGVMVDDPMSGRLLGPNITGGKGSRVLGYAPRDWDRIVRHGVRPDGRPGAMPAEDFQRMSDQELSDIVFFVQSQPPVDNEVPRVRLGPLGKVLLATRALPLSADLIESHDAPHRATPPPAEVSVEFGRHLAGVCVGCHRQDLAGGPIVGGDPSWVPARNLTPHATGLAGWSFEQFVTAMREARRPDGTTIGTPMTAIVPYAQQMTETEIRALWTYLQALPAVASRE